MTPLTRHSLKGYLLKDRVGESKYSQVYRAEESGLEHSVAVKIILPEYANRPEFIRRFEVEAGRVARLEHAHIVPLYDYWRDPDGAYLIMRWLPRSLNAALAEGPFNLSQAAQLLDEIAAALALAHRHGIIHRNLKPSNILLDDQGSSYLADFGIAREDTLADTPGYLAPEQIRGESDITPQADEYSLGILLYEILTGKHPFPAPDPDEQTSKHLEAPLPSLRDADADLSSELADLAELDTVLRRATARDPGQRFPDVISLAAAFRESIAGSKETAPRTIPAPTTTDVKAAEQITTTALERFIKGSSGIRWRFQKQVQNPYKGLRAFEEADAADFFGREALTERLVARLANQGTPARFLAVVGPSGSGKSSAVKAGLLPALRRGALPGSDRWFIAEMSPKAHPLDELRVALLHVATQHTPDLDEALKRDENALSQIARLIVPADSELLLVVDQFEEVFTRTEDQELVRRFLSLIARAVADPESRVRVIIMLRADFYDRPLLYPEFSDLVRRSTEVVLPLTPDEMERAIVAPMERAGVTPGARLVATIVSDVAEQPGTLPMLQYALTELFDRREGNALVLSDYTAIGGVLGALARRADEVYDGLTAAQQEAARQLFLRLVMLGEGAEDTRRQALQSEILSLKNDALQDVLAAFGESRLLTFDRDPGTREPTVEVAHEAIIREWSQLRVWLDESRSDIRQQRLLATAAQEWQASQKDTSFLAGGSRLDQLESWLDATDLALSQEENDYVQASIAHREVVRAAEAERRAREERLKRRSRRILQALAAVFVVAGGLVVFSLTQSQQRQLAEDHAREVLGLSLASNSLVAMTDGNTDLAIALALEATEIESRPEAVRALAAAAYAPGTRRVLTGHADQVSAIAISPDGKSVLSGSSDETLRLWDLQTGEELRRFEGHEGTVTAVAFSSDGKTAISGSSDTTLRLWDLQTGEELRRFEGHSEPVSGVALSPDGSRAISSSDDDTLILWSVESGRALSRFTGHESDIWNMALSPDGSRVLSASADTTMILWDAESGEVLRRFEGHGADVTSVAFSPDGEMGLSGSWDATLRLWDLRTGRFIREFVGHSDPVLTVAFSPDGQHILSGSLDKSVIVWDVESGESVEQLNGHTDWVTGVVFDPDGSAAISGSADATLRLWDLDAGSLIRTFEAPAPAQAVAFSPDGQTALSGSGEATLHLWDLQTGEELRRFEGHTDVVNSVAISPDGNTALSGSLDTTARLWDLQTGEELRRLEGHTEEVKVVAFSPDGQQALTAATDSTVRLWDLDTGEELRRFEGHTDWVWGLDYSPDGDTALTASRDATLRLWDLGTGELIRVFEAHTPPQSVAFSPDGRLALSSMNDGTISLWDVETGEERRRFTGHRGPVYSVAFSPDGQTALSGSSDGTVRLWDIESGLEIRRFEGHEDWIWEVAFSPDGSTALSGSADKTLRLWHVHDPDELVNWTYENRYIYELSCSERETYRVEPLCDTAQE